jgi:two-component system sensor histidine kinase RegB
VVSPPGIRHHERVSPVAPEPHAINFSWLLQLRWWAIAGQVVTIMGVDRLMHIALPLPPLFAIIAVELTTNAACALLVRAGRPVEDWWAGTIMAIDVLLLTGLLYVAGGPFNPFSFLYLVQIALAAVILRARWTWALVVLSLFGFGVLFVASRPLPLDGLTHADHMRVHQEGMWVAFGVAASFIVYFLMRVRRSLEERERDLSQARQIAARQEKLASLATLAAGAAHELSTPLGTIALAARELERQSGSLDAGAVEDVRLIRSQVERCRAILERMAADAGQTAGEGMVAVSVEELVAAALAGLPAEPPVRVELTAEARGHRLHLPPRAVAQALRGVVRNAQDASPAGVVVVRATVGTAGVRIEVADRGAGMPPDVLARAGEPFFTTKPPGRGMGLGLFLTRTLLERLGGQLELRSLPGAGTTAILSLPAVAANIDRMAGAA